MAHAFREAEIRDADAIGRVHVAAWRAAYRGTMSDAFLDALDAAGRASRWRARLERGFDAGQQLFVAEDGGALVGFAGIGPERGGPAGELYAINLEPRAWGSGIGAALLAHATRALAGLGHREAVLWVVRDNARARRFYEREGWRADGTEARRDLDENGVTTAVDEVRYRRAL
jgi:GNAT superfamily N-acetyltransferase